MLDRRPVRLVLPLSASLGLHLFVAAWLVRGEVRPPTVVPVERAIELEFVTLPSRAPAPPAASPTPSTRPGPAPKLPRSPTRLPTNQAVGRERTGVEPRAATAPPAAPLTTEQAQAATRPRATSLVPRADLLGEPLLDEPRGRTLHPGDLPTREAQLEAERARVSSLVDGWARRDLMAAKVAAQAYDPAYSQLRGALREATAEVPTWVDTNDPKAVVGALLERWGAGAERYGRTGASYAEPEGRLESLETPAGLVAEMNLRHPAALALGQFLAAGARLQEFSDGRAGLELFALVQVDQAPSGALESVRLLRPSGLSPFDAWVLERARHVGATFHLDAGLRARPLRSVWRFDAVMTFRRKLTPGQLDGRAAVGMMTMAALSLLSGLGNDSPPLTPGGPPGPPLGPRMPGLTGRFDELSGTLDVVDLTNPAYDCRVTLLEAD